MNSNVVYQFNEKYAPYAGVSITSLLTNNCCLNEICIYILGEELSNDSIRRLQSIVEQFHRKIVFVDTTKWIDKMREMGMPAYRGSYSANLRLFLPYLIEDDIDTLLYLDADTIVVDKLEKLYASIEGDKPLYMALDSLGKTHGEAIGLGKNDFYFNSGVILFEMKRWKENHLSEKIVEHGKNVRANYPSPDQDLLNVVCRGQIGVLNPQYNFQPVHVAFRMKDYSRVYGLERYYSITQLEEAKAAPCIYHFFRFIGEFPWNAKTVHPDTALFDQYLKDSTFSDYVKRKADLGLVFQIEKMMYQVLPKAWFLRIFKMAHIGFIKKSNQMSMDNKINPNM